MRCVKVVLLFLLIAGQVFIANNNSLAYELVGSSWPNSQTTMYSTGGDSNATFDNAFVEAMNSWNNLSNFQFTNAGGFKDPCANPNAEGPPWYSGYSFRSDSCGSAFGSSTLAVNIRWSIGTEIIQAGVAFNTAWSWDVHSGAGAAIDFKRVAAHELGHALGLSHENINTALMNPTYSESIETPQSDDIDGIRAIYGGGSDSTSDVEAFVTRFYQQCLSREPDAPGLNDWTTSLQNGTKTGSDVAYGFIFSVEFIDRNTSNETYVTILYRAFFDREPDTVGYNNWINSLNSGSSRESVLNGFIYSLEFENLCNRYGITPYPNA